MATIELFATVTKYDPTKDFRYAPSGKAWIKVNMAENRKGKNGEEITTWWKLKAFGAQAEQLAEQLRTGARLKVRGFLDVDEWKGDDGQKRIDLVVKPFADGVTVEEPRSHVGGQSFGDRRSQPSPASQAAWDKSQGGAADDPWATPARPATNEPPF